MLDHSDTRLQFLVLYRHFLGRVIDLEAISAEADVAKLLGQFSAVLIMFSIIQGGLALFIDLNRMPIAAQLGTSWSMEHRLIATTMVVVGLFAVLSWDATFPDRRDVMILAPLPVRAPTLFVAKVAASVTMLGLSILALNILSGITWPLILSHNGFLGIVRSFGAYWFTIAAAGIFLYCSLLAVQGFSAQLLARRYALRLSAILQLTAFCLFLGVYFLEPGLVTQSAIASPEHQRILARLPTYWYLGLFNQLNGSTNPVFTSLAWRAWIGLALAVSGAISASLISYFRTMRKIVEEADIIPAPHNPHWTPYLGNALQTSILLFSFRSIKRNRQHRIILAFYLGVGFAIALSCLNIPAARQDLSRTPLHTASLRFLISTIVMMSFSVVGTRIAFSLPVSLPANWILRVTQVHATSDYIAATRRSLLILAVAPVLICSAVLSLPFQPWSQLISHLILLGMLGCIFTELSLLQFNKIPFACSILPGKANVQFVFWLYLLLLIPLTEKGAIFEQHVLEYPLIYMASVGILGIAILALWAYNVVQSKSAVLKFEELPATEIVTLDL